MYGPTGIFWANLTPFSLKGRLSVTLEQALLDTHVHKYHRTRCMVCTQCGFCTGYGPPCSNTPAGGRPREGAVQCGCGVGDSGCIVCGRCRSCCEAAGGRRLRVKPANVEVVEAPAGLEAGLLTQGALGVPQDPLAPRRGPLESSPDRERAIENAPALVPGPLARLWDPPLLTGLSP